MKAVQVQFVPWDKVYDFDPNNLNLVEGDSVIVKTDLGVEIGKVVGFSDIANKDIATEEASFDDNDKMKEDGLSVAQDENKDRKLEPVVRQATAFDFEKLAGSEEKREALEYCKKMVEKNQLEMKLIDVYFSFDGAKVTFAFIADGRVDFRELVKDLTRHFNKTVRLHQIGIRDEAKLKGDYGPCGRPLCCKKFLNDLTSITSEMAECQQVVHRGSDRISGMCGRLMCCLAFEQAGYKELAEKMPPLGAKVNVDGQKGTIVGHNILKQSVNVKFSGDNGEGNLVTEVDLNRKNKQ